MNQDQTTTLMGVHSRLLTLKLLPRTGWLQRGLNNVESIAEHSFSLAALAMFVSDHVPGLDHGRLLSIALLHDMAEALVGDLPFSARRLFGVEAKQAAERKGIIEMLQDLPQAAYYLALWDEYSEGASREARLIKQLDRVEMLSQALLYERTGSRVMGEFWEDIEDGWSNEFPIVTDIVQHLIAERQRLNGLPHLNGHQSGKNGGMTNGHGHLQQSTVTLTNA